MRPGCGTCQLPTPARCWKVVSQMWEYIRSHNLQNPENRREILADDKLTKVLGKAHAKQILGRWHQRERYQSRSGTTSSNPAPSRGESANHLFLSGGAKSAATVPAFR